MVDFVRCDVIGGTVRQGACIFFFFCFLFSFLTAISKESRLRKSCLHVLDDNEGRGGGQRHVVVVGGAGTAETLKNAASAVAAVAAAVVAVAKRTRVKRRRVMKK